MPTRADGHVFEPPPHLALVLDGTIAGRTARRELEALLISGGASAELHDNTALVVAELVTNAVQAAGRCSLTAWHLADRGVVRIEVVDTSPEMPVMQPLDVARVGGHGLRIVDAVTTRWGVIRDAHRKSAWAELEA